MTAPCPKGILRVIDSPIANGLTPLDTSTRAHGDGVLDPAERAVRKVTSLTGPQLKAYRRAAGFSQTAMALQIGCSRDAVSYWERKPCSINTRFGVPKAMCAALGVEVLRNYLPSMRTCDHGVLSAELERWRDRERERAAKRRVQCGAKTRKGHPCRLKSEAGKTRCKFHGGLSTGPRTVEGRARIAAAQRERWRKWRLGC